ncbi:MAG: aminotransferase class III-fold pyridoxal phosphate-dependent enzyme [Betaproteobacteria bacterium]
MKRIIAMVIAGAAIAVGMAGAANAQKKTLVVGAASADAGKLDPHQTAQGADKTLLNWVFNAMVRIKPGQASPDFIEPDLAESWTSNAAGTEWTFKIRTGVQCHYGYGEFTAEDAAYSLKPSANKDTSSFAGDFAALESTGPFMFVEYQPQQFVKLTANKQYFRGAPELDAITHRYIPSDATRDLAYQAGEVDMMFGQQTDAWVKRMRGTGGTKVVAMEPAELTSLYLNTTVKPLNDARVRLAFNHAIDRKSLAQFLGGDGAREPISVVPRGNMGGASSRGISSRRWWAMREHSAVFYRDLKHPPPLIVRGDGVYIEDADGRRYLDASASAGVVGIGHGRTEIWDALAREGSNVDFVYNATFTHPWQEQLASAILDLAPSNMAGVYFISGGSEANESAWKLARQYFVEGGKAQKYKAISRWQSYHGVSLGTLSLSGRTTWRSIYSPLLLPVTKVAPPYQYRCALCAGNGGCSLACADDLERAILLEGPETVAAFFAEPVVGTSAAGLVPHPDYYPRVREICDAHDVLFVADEVLCGYGRTGLPFAISAWKKGPGSNCSVEPDIITLGKALGSGYAPLAAMVVSDKIRQTFAEGSGRFVHGLTYSGMASSCFIGLEVQKIMQREGLFTRAAEVGAVLMQRLSMLAERHEMIGEVRGRGLLIGLEFVADRTTRMPFDRSLRVTDRLVAHLRKRDVLVCRSPPSA